MTCIYLRLHFFSCDLTARIVDHLQCAKSVCDGREKVVVLMIELFLHSLRSCCHVNRHSATVEYIRKYTQLSDSRQESRWGSEPSPRPSRLGLEIKFSGTLYFARVALCLRGGTSILALAIQSTYRFWVQFLDQSLCASTPGLIEASFLDLFLYFLRAT